MAANLIYGVAFYRKLCSDIDMKNLLLILLVAIVLAGCAPKATPNSEVHASNATVEKTTGEKVADEAALWFGILMN